jgi:predicted RNA-binding Zn ribbon-like protein
MQGTWRLELDAAQYRGRRMQFAEEERLLRSVNADDPSPLRQWIDAVRETIYTMIRTRKTAGAARLSSLNQSPSA